MLRKTILLCIIFSVALVGNGGSSDTPPKLQPKQSQQSQAHPLSEGDQKSAEQDKLSENEPGTPKKKKRKKKKKKPANDYWRKFHSNTLLMGMAIVAFSCLSGYF